jgi:Ca2+-binding EF-hand superfamily protein
MVGLRNSGVVVLALGFALVRCGSAQNAAASLQNPNLPPVAGMGFDTPPTAARVPGFDVPLGFVPTVPLEKRFDVRVYERARESMRDRDRNKNGTLDGEEWTRSNWDPPLAKSDVDNDGLITLEELCYRYQVKSQTDNPELWASGKLRVGTIAIPPPPLFPGLMGSPATQSFATPKAAAVPTATLNTEKTPDDGKLRKFAESMISRSDENRSGKLERSEWTRLPQPEAADTNRDGVITLEEMMARLAAFGELRGDKWSRREESRRPETAAPQVSAPRPYAKSYRPLTAQERLPTDLPAWFYELDADADGQISMAEFLVDSNYSDERAVEFMALDKSSDGLLSAAECKGPATEPPR